MVKTTIGVGVLLSLLGLILYLVSGAKTALIPTCFGLGLIVLGIWAAKGSTSARMHTMHVAVVITVLGLIGSLMSAIKGLGPVLSGSEAARPLAVAGQLAMAVFCLVHVILSVRSFIMARRERD